MSTSTASSARSTARALAPVVQLGATWAARKGMIKAYESGTGRPAPVVRSTQSRLVEKVLWAATMAAVMVLVEVIVYKAAGLDE